jgi:hypothetical protein
MPRLTRMVVCLEGAADTDVLQALQRRLCTFETYNYLSTTLTD